MISFIVIGRNEGWKLIKCFESIYKTIWENNLIYYEVIYVDSNSEDNSIDTAKKYNVNKVFKITGKCNAAIGRNIGALESKGDVLCFIDGDIEIMPAFFPLIYSESLGLVYPLIAGKLVNYYYDHKGKLLRKDPLCPAFEERFENLLEGAFFVITRKDWFSVGGMRNIFKTGEDYDLGLRLKKSQGLSKLKKKEVSAIHNTIDRYHKDRMWRDLFMGKQVYHRSFLYRHHIFNPFVYKKFIRSDFALIILFLATIFTIFEPNFLFFSFYFVLVFAKAFIVGRRKSKNLFSQYFYFVARDLMNLFTFIFLYPKKDKKIDYHLVK